MPAVLGVPNLLSGILLMTFCCALTEHFPYISTWSASVTRVCLVLPNLNLKQTQSIGDEILNNKNQKNKRKHNCKRVPYAYAMALVKYSTVVLDLYEMLLNA